MSKIHINNRNNQNLAVIVEEHSSPKGLAYVMHGLGGILCGHSLGGICTALYAEKYPNKVKALAPISTVVSGELSKEKYSKEDLKNWEKTGRHIKKKI